MPNPNRPNQERFEQRMAQSAEAKVAFWWRLLKPVILDTSRKIVIVDFGSGPGDVMMNLRSKMPEGKFPDHVVYFCHDTRPFRGRRMLEDKDVLESEYSYYIRGENVYHTKHDSSIQTLVATPNSAGVVVIALFSSVLHELDEAGLQLAKDLIQVSNFTCVYDWYPEGSYVHPQGVERADVTERYPQQWEEFKAAGHYNTRVDVSVWFTHFLMHVLWYDSGPTEMKENYFRTTQGFLRDLGLRREDALVFETPEAHNTVVDHVQSFSPLLTVKKLMAVYRPLSTKKH